MVRPALITARVGRNVVRPALIAARHASTASSSTTPSSTSTSSPSKLPLSWPDYLSLRRQRRLWSRACTVPTTLAGLTLGGGYFGSMETDPTQTIMGLDPMLLYAGATIGCMGLGYLVGPTLGGFIFSLTRPAMARGNPSPLEVMDREFFRRISKRRGDPSFQSVNNPAPDFYGEKIVSISTYRRWLRDQAAYNRKAMHGLPESR